LTNVYKNAGESVTRRFDATGADDLKGLVRTQITETKTHIKLRITDNGMGWPFPDKERLLEPYVTTRDSGTGLGGSAMDGIELLDTLKVIHPNLPVIIISGHGTVETAVSAIRKGAYDYIVKPFKADKLLVTASRALENARLRRENEELKGKTASDYTLVGSSPQIIQLRQKITKIAATNSRVLITGPSGSGKELIARLLHNQSVREQGPFKAVNAASMVPERVEEELFGGPFKAVNAASMVPERVEEELFGAEDDEGNSTKIGLLERV